MHGVCVLVEAVNGRYLLDKDRCLMRGKKKQVPAQASSFENANNQCHKTWSSCVIGLVSLLRNPTELLLGAAHFLSERLDASYSAVACYDSCL